MKFALDTEFIDTPTCSALISLALASEDGRACYYEFDFPSAELTPWLNANVVPHLSVDRVSFKLAASELRDFVGASRVQTPEIWCYYGAFDWYWLCRVFGGMIQLPEHWPRRFREFADLHTRIIKGAGPKHHALSDAIDLMTTIKAQLT